MESPGASRGARIGWLRREGDESGPAAQELAEEVDAVLATLPAGAADGHQHGLGAGACPGAIAAPDLAQDDAEPNRQFRAPVGGIQAGEFEKGQQVIEMVPQVLSQAFAGRVGFGRINRVGQLVVQPAAADGQAMEAQSTGGVPIPKVQSRPK